MHWLGQQALVTLPEYFDVSNAEQIRDELLGVINRGAEALIADMTATVFCDHAGTDAMARAYQWAASIWTPLRLVVTSGAVLQIIGMNGAGRLVPVYPSVPAALAALRPAAGRPAANPRPDRSVKAAKRAAGQQRDKPETYGGVEAALRRRHARARQPAAGRDVRLSSR